MCVCVSDNMRTKKYIMELSLTAYCISFGLLIISQLTFKISVVVMSSVLSISHCRSLRAFNQHFTHLGLLVFIAGLCMILFAIPSLSLSLSRLPSHFRSGYVQFCKRLLAIIISNISNTTQIILKHQHT